MQQTRATECPCGPFDSIPTPARFTVDGQSFDLYHGMNGTVEARVRTESILVSLVPSLRALFGRTDE